MGYIIIACIVVASLCAFVMCIYDKRAAVKNKRRISEKALLIVSIFGGATGMLLGMLLVRHKTRRWYFVLFVPLLIILHAVIVIAAMK